MIYCDDSQIGFGSVIMQHAKVIYYASRKLKMDKKNNSIDDLELVVVVFVLNIWRDYLYGVYVHD